MSRSYKKAIFKEGSGSNRRQYLRRKAKRSQKNYLKSNLDDIITGDKVIPDEKSIVNDYDYCDYVCNFEYDRKNYSKIEDDELKRRLSRK